MIPSKDDGQTRDQKSAPGEVQGRSVSPPVGGDVEASLPTNVTPAVDTFTPERLAVEGERPIIRPASSGPVRRGTHGQTTEGAPTTDAVGTRGERAMPETGPMGGGDAAPETTARLGNPAPPADAAEKFGGLYWRTSAQDVGAPLQLRIPQDVAALEEANRRLLLAFQAAEARFQSTVERSVDGVIVLDERGRVRFVNPAAEQLFGLTRAALLGTNFGFPTVAGDVTEIDVLHGGGEPVVADMRVAETAWEGEPALLVLIRDITDRKAAEERERALIHEQSARREAEAHADLAEMLDRATRALNETLDLDELLRSLARVMVEEIGEVCLIDIDDPSGTLRGVAAARRDDPRTALLKGLELPSRMGLGTPEARVFRTGESELVPGVTEEWLLAAGRGDDPTGVFGTLRPTSVMMVTLYAGTVPWGVVSVLSCDPEVRFGPGDLALAEELVRRAGINIENARLFRAAQEASRAKSDFLAIVSHELRTPLSAVIGYAGLLEEGIAGALTEIQHEYLGNLRRSAEHLLRLIDQVITFARLEGDHERVLVDEVDLVRVAGDIATLTRQLADRKGLSLVMVLPEGGLTLRSDEKKISQILINLVTNAIKYTDAGEVRVVVEPDGEWILLRVRDTGPGIPTDKHEEIFEPFHQLEAPPTRRAGGAGIGLSIVKNLTGLLGGQVIVDSRPGDGSTFTVRLPRVYRPVEAC